MENTTATVTARLAALTAPFSGLTPSGLYVGRAAPTVAALANVAAIATPPPAKAPRKTPVSPIYPPHTFSVWENTAPSMRGRCRVCGRKVGAAVHTARVTRAYLLGLVPAPAIGSLTPTATYKAAAATKVAAYAPAPLALPAPVAPTVSKRANAVARARRTVNTAPPVSAALSLD